MKLLTPFTIFQLLIAALIAVLAIVAFSYKPLVEEYVLAQVWKGCAQAYRTEFNDTNTNTVVVTPIETEVEDCVQELVK